MAYRCGQAIIGRAEESIRCKVSGSVCAHQKMCLMEGRIVLTDGALRCPARDGKLPGEASPAKKEAQAAAEAPKARVRKTAEKAPAKKTAAKTAERTAAKTGRKSK